MNKWYTTPKAVSLLTNERCIRREYKQMGTWDILPRSSLLHNIPLIWQFLDMIRQDWEHASSQYQEELDENPENIYFQLITLRELPPVFLKCLFSFAFFSVSLEKAYEALRTDLNKLNKESCFRIKPTPKPKKSPYLEKVRSIRNNTIAHLNSDRLDDLNAYYALMWDVGWSTSQGENWHVDKINFKQSKFIRKDLQGNVIKESIDYEVDGFAEFYNECMDYFAKEDTSCSDFLTAIEAKLPAENDEHRFTVFSTPQSNENQQ